MIADRYIVNVEGVIVLGLPAFAVLSLPNFCLSEVIENV